MKKEDIKTLLTLLCLLFTVCLTIFVFIHRRVIRAALAGETLPPLPENHPVRVQRLHG